MIIEPPVMQPCRPEMRDLTCAGLTEDCGWLVTLACPRCGVHRCERCTAVAGRCPACAATDMFFPEHWMPKSARAHLFAAARGVLRELK